MRLCFVLQLACLFLYRSRKTTFILSFMVLTAVAALVVLSALAVGTNDAMIGNSTGLYSGHIVGSKLQPEDLPLPSIIGVDRVLIRKHLPVLLGKDGHFEPLILIGVDAAAEKATTTLWKKTLNGRYPHSGEASLFIGQSTAERLGIGVGDPLLVSNRDRVPMASLIVTGIYRTGITHLDQEMAFCPVESLPGQAFNLGVAVFLVKGTPEDVVVASYRKFLPAASFVGWPEFMPDLKQLIDLDHICMGIVVVLVFAIVSVGISCAFHIFILKNLRDHGIMKAMGVLPSDTALLLIAQILLLTLLAAALGTLVGAGISAIFSNIGIDISAFTSHNQYFAVSGLLYPRLTLMAVLTPPSAAIVFGLLAAIWPTTYLLRKGPAEILRGA